MRATWLASIAQAHADRGGRRCVRRDSCLGSLSRLGRRGTARWRRGRGSLGRSPGGGSRARRAGAGTRPCSCAAGVMTCAMCARTARRALIARASAGSPTRSTASGSRGRCSRTRCCPRRSSAQARSKNNRRRSILTGRQHLVGEAEYLLCELPLELREQLPDTKGGQAPPGGARVSQPSAPPTTRRPGCGCTAVRSALGPARPNPTVARCPRMPADRLTTRRPATSRLEAARFHDHTAIQLPPSP
jgi:hypothetical protein